MSNEFKDLTSAKSWHLLVKAGRQAAEAEGYELDRQPGRGRSNIWKAKRDGKEQLACIRTTRDRWIAFPPMKGGWKTLDKVDLVIVAAVDDADDPRHAEVFIFEADEVRERFNDSYKARIEDGQSIRDDFGMWVCLDRYDRDVPASVGSGLAEEHEPIAVYSLSELTVSGEAQDREPSEVDEDRRIKEPQTIAEVLAGASADIAKIAGVDPSSVKLDLKIES